MCVCGCGRCFAIIRAGSRSSVGYVGGVWRWLSDLCLIGLVRRRPARVCLPPLCGPQQGGGRTAPQASRVSVLWARDPVGRSCRCLQGYQAARNTSRRWIKPLVRQRGEEGASLRQRAGSSFKFAVRFGTLFAAVVQCSRTGLMGFYVSSHFDSGSGTAGRRWGYGEPGRVEPARGGAWRSSSFRLSPGWRGGSGGRACPSHQWRISAVVFHGRERAYQVARSVAPADLHRQPTRAGRVASGGQATGPSVGSRACERTFRPPFAGPNGSGRHEPGRPCVGAAHGRCYGGCSLRKPPVLCYEGPPYRLGATGRLSGGRDEAYADGFVVRQRTNSARGDAAMDGPCTGHLYPCAVVATTPKDDGGDHRRCGPPAAPGPTARGRKARGSELGGFGRRNGCCSTLRATDRCRNGLAGSTGGAARGSSSEGGGPLQPAQPYQVGQAGWRGHHHGVGPPATWAPARLRWRLRPSRALGGSQCPGKLGNLPRRRLCLFDLAAAPAGHPTARGVNRRGGATSLQACTLGWLPPGGRVEGSGWRYGGWAGGSVSKYLSGREHEQYGRSLNLSWHAFSVGPQRSPGCRICFRGSATMPQSHSWDWSATVPPGEADRDAHCTVWLFRCHGWTHGDMRQSPFSGRPRWSWQPWPWPVGKVHCIGGAVWGLRWGEGAEVGWFHVVWSSGFASDFLGQAKAHQSCHLFPLGWAQGGTRCPWHEQRSFWQVTVHQPNRARHAWTPCRRVV